MSVAIVGKLLGGLVVSSSGIAAITYMVINSNSPVELDKKDSKNNIYIYAISKKVVSESAEDNITEYKCKFDKQDYQCIVSKVADFDNTTKQTYVDDPNMIDPKGANKEIVANELTTADTIYKILINSKIGDWTKTTEDKQNNQKTLSIDITSKTDPSEKYASLTPLFAIKSGGLSDEYTKTEYFVVKKNEVSPSNTSVAAGAAATSTHTCSTTNDQNVETKNESCDIYDFSDDVVTNDKTLHTLVFKKPVTPTTDTSLSTANKHYLVKLNEPVTVDKVKHINITASGSTVSFQNKEIIPAIQITDKADGIFILEKKSST